MAASPEVPPSLPSPRTRSPVKGVRTGGTTCTGADALSMLNMLAEVASVTLHTDPAVTNTPLPPCIKLPGNSPSSGSSSTTSSTSNSRNKSSEFELLTLEQVLGMTDNLLLKLFAEFQSNEMWRRFTYTCGMLPAACSKYFQSFGSEHKARAGMKAHLHTHLKSLCDVHCSTDSQRSYLLESVPARKRRLSQQTNPAPRKRSTAVQNRNKPTAPKVHSRSGDQSTKIKRVATFIPEKENEALRKHVPVKDKKVNPSNEASHLPSSRSLPDSSGGSEPKTKRKLEVREEYRVRTKKVRVSDPRIRLQGEDINHDNNNNSDVKVEEEIIPPMQQLVSHDHGYLKLSPPPPPGREEEQYSHYHHHQDSNTQEDDTTNDVTHHRINTHIIPQVVDGSGNGVVDSTVYIITKDDPEEDHSTLLHQHMNQELQGGMMAQDCGSSGTPLPVVGCEVDCTPEQQYKLNHSGEVPVVYDHNNPNGDSHPVAKIIERDEYKVRKKPKGRAKFIGQSKAEKEMALKLISEIRSQSVMALETLECKICDPPRLFTAPSTLLSHYRSHAGIRPYECRICEAVFTRQHSLNYHMLIHTNQTRFTCVDCGRKFRHPSHFKEHRRRHTGESPYQCEDCLIRFKTRNTYKRHLRTRHGKLLTTQGSIVVLSQEEADRIKKTQGRKPRRPRQPLKIISPEAAAQMEEEQVWTDFEEGDREEEEDEEDDDEEEEEEEEGDEEVPQLNMFQPNKLVNVIRSQVPAGNFGVAEVLKANGKTGLIVRSKKVNIVSRDPGVETLKHWDANLLSSLTNSVDNTLKGEIVEEEIVTDDVTGDIRTFVFQPPPEHNSLPKVNIRSSWNTINIDLKNLEMASDTAPLETTSKVSVAQEVVVNGRKEAQTQNKATNACTVLVGEQISPEEVITICAQDSNSQGIRQQQNGSTLVGNNDWYTVKKPLKCYGRSGHSEPSDNVTYTTNDSVDNVTYASNDLVDNVTYVSNDSVAYGSNENMEPDTINDTQGLYVVEYIHGEDGRLAKVYRASAALVSKAKQQQQMVVDGPPTTSTTTKYVCGSGGVTYVSSGSGSNDGYVSNSGVPNAIRPVTYINPSTTSGTLATFMSKPTHRQDVSIQNGIIAKVSNPTIAAITSENGGAVINEQVVSNVVVNNHVVKNGSVVNLREEEGSKLQSSPSVIVTTVPHVMEVTQTDFLPWSSQIIPNNPDNHINQITQVNQHIISQNDQIEISQYSNHMESNGNHDNDHIDQSSHISYESNHHVSSNGNHDNHIDQSSHINHESDNHINQINITQINHVNSNIDHTPSNHHINSNNHQINHDEQINHVNSNINHDEQINHTLSDNQINHITQISYVNSNINHDHQINHTPSNDHINSNITHINHINSNINHDHQINHTPSNDHINHIASNGEVEVEQVKEGEMITPTVTTYPIVVHQEEVVVDHLPVVDIRDNLLLESVEIVEGFEVGEKVVSVDCW